MKSIAIETDGTRINTILTDLETMAKLDNIARVEIVFDADKDPVGFTSCVLTPCVEEIDKTPEPEAVELVSFAMREPD